MPSTFTHPARAVIAATIVAIALAVTLSACDASGTAAPSPAAAASPSAAPAGSAGPSASPSPSATPSASAASTAPDPSIAAPSPSIGQTDTEFGRIWDAVPASFPRFPGSSTTEIGHASSDQRIVTGSADEVAAWYQSALETAGYSTEALSGPLEDGSMVIDSVGEPLECRVQVGVRPVAEMVVIDILYGADCPLD